MGILEELTEKCVFCGEAMKSSYEEYNEYHYCDCPDYKLNRSITEKMRKLEESRPRPKFEYRQTLCRRR